MIDHLIITTRKGNHKMSFQAYLDNVEKKTGKTPREFIKMAEEKNLTEYKEIVDWLKSDYGLGTGHAKAIVYVIQHGPEFELRHTTGTHRDESGTLNLDGKGNG
jgi:hypothetical protein